MIHFFHNLDWWVISLFITWSLLMLQPKFAKELLIATLALLAIFCLVGIIAIGTSNSINKYLKYCIIHVHKQKSGDYTVVVKKYGHDYKRRKNILFKN